MELGPAKQVKLFWCRLRRGATLCYCWGWWQAKVWDTNFETRMPSTYGSYVEPFPGPITFVNWAHLHHPSLVSQQKVPEEGNPSTLPPLYHSLGIVQSSESLAMRSTPGSLFPPHHGRQGRGAELTERWFWLVSPIDTRWLWVMACMLVVSSYPGLDRRFSGFSPAHDIIVDGPYQTHSLVAN